MYFNIIIFIYIFINISLFFNANTGTKVIKNDENSNKGELQRNKRSKENCKSKKNRQTFLRNQIDRVRNNVLNIL